MKVGRRRLGLGIGRDRVSAALLVGHAVKWAASRERDPGASLGEALRPLLAECPRRGLLPITVTAAFGPSISQLKCLTELPPIAAPRALTAMVQENVGRFFLRNGMPLVVSGALLETPGRVWVAAFDAPLAEEAAAACRDAGLNLRCIVPAAVALRRTTRDDSIVCTDGDIQLNITFAAAAPASVRRIPFDGTTPRAARPIEDLAALQASMPHALDAAGAALTRRHDSILVRVQAPTPPVATARAALRRSAAVLALAVVAALVSPGIATSIAVHRDRARQAAISARAQLAERNAKELAAASTTLRALSDFGASRRSMTLLLAEVTRGLPDSTTLVAFQVDSTGLGSVVALAPHAAAVIDAVERLPSLSSPSILGPVTRESVGGRNVERVTVQFRLLPVRVP